MDTLSTSGRSRDDAHGHVHDGWGFGHGRFWIGASNRQGSFGLGGAGHPDRDVGVLSGGWSGDLDREPTWR